MTEYLIQDTILTNLADKIRVLSGTEETLTPAEMDTNLTTANTEIGSQSDIIAQIIEIIGVVRTISFYIGGDEHSTEENMTWAEWITSNYNDYGYRLNSSGGVMTGSDTPIGDESGNEVFDVDVIVAGANYQLLY